MSPRRLLSTLRLYLAFLAPGLVFATDDTARLPELVVTPTRTAAQLSEVPVSVTVITAAQIQEQNIISLDDAVNHVVGVWSRRTRGMADVGAAVSMRGVFGSERNLIMIDNIPLNPTVWGGVPWSGINIDQVERIEVVRGPYSALYGLNAMGGVINIITKTPMQRAANIETGYGGNHTQILRANYGDRVHDKWSYALAGEYRYSTGYPTYVNTAAAGSAAPGDSGTAIQTPRSTTTAVGASRYLIGDAGDNPVEDWNVYGKLAYDIAPGEKISVHSTHSRQADEWGNDPNLYLRDTSGNPVLNGTFLFDDKKMTIKESAYLGWIFGGRDNDILVANYQRPLNAANTLKIDAGYSDQFRYYTIADVFFPADATRSGGPGAYYEYPSRVMQVNVQNEWAARDRLMLVAGVALRHDHGEQHTWNLGNWRNDNSKIAKTIQVEGDSHYYSAYAQAEYAPRPAWTVIPALRYDYWETEGATHVVGMQNTSFDTRSDSMLSPKVSVGYQAGAMTRLRASTGLGYKPPEIDKLYRILPGVPGTSQPDPVFPNRELDPEKIFSWELGVEQALPGNRGQVSMTYFENHIEDSLFEATVGGQRQWISGGEAAIKGIETEGRYQVLPPFALLANFTWLDSEVIDHPVNPTLEGNRLTFTPELAYNVGAEAILGQARGALWLRHVDKVFARDDNTDTAEHVPGGQDEYTVVDLDLHYRLNPQLTVSGSISNLLDEDYYLSWKAAGREWLVKLRYDL